MRMHSHGTPRGRGGGTFRELWTGDQVPLGWNPRDIAPHAGADWQALYQRVNEGLDTRNGLDVRNFVAALSAIGGHAALTADLIDAVAEHGQDPETVVGACGRVYHVSEAVNETLLSMSGRSFASVVIAASLRAGATRAPSLVQIQFQVQVAMRSRRFPDYSIEGHERPTVNPLVLLRMFVEDVRAMFGQTADGMRSACGAAGEAVAHAILVHRTERAPAAMAAIALETALTFAKARIDL